MKNKTDNRKVFGKDNPKWITRESRICQCGCGKKFICKENSNQRFINHHESFTRKIPDETRICQCGCNKKFKCRMDSKQRYINLHSHPGKPKVSRIERSCKCGCGKFFICTEKSTKKFIFGHQMNGRKHSKITLKKLSDQKKGDKNPSRMYGVWNKGLKGVQIAWNKGITNFMSPEGLESLRKARLGKKLPLKTRKKIGEANTGNICAEKTKQKISIANRGEKNGNWLGGISFEPYPITFNSQLKDKIRVRDNFKCRECGIPELENYSPLDIHHIDYNKKNCLEINLVALCDSCHGKTNANRQYWQERLSRVVST